MKEYDVTVYNAKNDGIIFIKRFEEDELNKYKKELAERNNGLLLWDEIEDYAGYTEYYTTGNLKYRIEIRGYKFQ